MRRLIPFAIAIMMTAMLFWQFFVKGFIPIPSSFMAAWYEPWKTKYSNGGVPTIPHKAVGDDLFRQIYPMRTLAADIVKQGHMPLWNPYNGAGQPLLATLHTGIANPFALMQQISPVTGWAWVIILQFPLLFLATYWYLRTLDVSRFGSMISAVVLTVSGVVTTRLIYADYVYALIGLPLLLGMAELAAKGRRLWLYGAPPVIAYILVAVQPQISAYILLTYGAYTAVRIPKRWKDIVLTLVLGIGLSMAQMLPTLELYTYANVTKTSSEFIFGKFLMPVSHFITLFIPNYFGNSGTYNFWGSTDYTETVMSMGLLSVAFAVFARFAGRKNSGLSAVARFYYCAVGITAVLTVSWWGTRLLYALPVPVLSTSIPSRLYLLTSFYIAVLSGIGAHVWQHNFPPRKTAGTTIAGIWIAALVGVIVTWILAKKGVIICPSQVPTCMSVAFRNSVLELVIFTAGGVALILGLMHGFFIKRKALAELAVVLVLICAGIYNAWKFVPMSSPQYVGEHVKLLEAMASQTPNRVAGIGGAALSTDFATQHRFMDTNYYDPLYIRRYGELVSYVNTADRINGLTRSDVQIISDATVSAELSFRRDRFWDMTGTSVLSVKKSDALSPKGEMIWEDAHWALYTRPTALPRAYLVSHVVVPTGQDWELSGLFSPETDLSKTAFIDVPRGSMPGAPQDAGTATIRTYEAHRVVVDINARIPGFLVLSDTYFPGWKASVDTVDTHIYRTNYAFRGVSVPKGPHVVEFRYEPESFTFGLWIGGISFGAWLVIMWSLGRKRT